MENPGSTDVGLKEPLLLDPHRYYEDLRLVAKAAKHRWPTSDAAKTEAVKRLRGIIKKTSVSMVTRQGELVNVELPADINSIQAAKVLVDMEGQNQKDDHAEEGIGQGGIEINIGTDALQVKAQQYGLTESRLKRLVDRKTIEGTAERVENANPNS